MLGEHDHKFFDIDEALSYYNIIASIYEFSFKKGRVSGQKIGEKYTYIHLVCSQARRNALPEDSVELRKRTLVCGCRAYISLKWEAGYYTFLSEKGQHNHHFTMTETLTNDMILVMEELLKLKSIKYT
jgi:hypothetical protein